VAQFLAAGLLTAAAVMVGSSVLSARAAQDEALADALATTEVLAGSVAEPAVPRGLVDGDAGAVDRFDRLALERLLVRDVRRIKMWSRDGTIVYSDDVRLIGEQFALDDDELEILLDGGSDAEVADLEDPENRYEDRDEGLVEVYTQIWTPEGEPLLFEAYYSLRGIEARQAEISGPFLRITLGGLLVLVVVATALLWALNRREQAAAAERERLLHSAATASDAERRRIARDLHDGVVQDLAGTSFALSAAARDPGPVADTTVGAAADSLRTALRSLRSLLVEIHPPDLDADGLAAALEDLVAPAAAAGMEARVEVAGVAGAPDRAVRLLWRVAQEAVRNALRHSGGSLLEVRVERRDGRLALVVRDDGSGIDVSRAARAEHFGLRGMAGLVRDEGGRLDVESARGGGTTVTLEVDA
jgi:signal transduction histidine kinase